MPDKFAFIKQFFEEELPFNVYMGLRVDDLREGFALCHLPFKDEFVGDPFRRALHGGVTSMLVDVCAGLASLSTLPLGSRCSTVDLRVDYLRPAGPHDLWARGEVLRTGSQVAVVEISVYQLAQGTAQHEVARGRAAYSLKPKFAEERKSGSPPEADSQLTK